MARIDSAPREAPRPQEAERRRVSEIQGRGRDSPFAGARVTTSGVVTAVVHDGFYLQDPAGDGDEATSDAVFVAGVRASRVRVGDEVRVTATVTEAVEAGVPRRLGSTQLTRAVVEVLSHGRSPPRAVIIGRGGRLPPNRSVPEAIDFFESLEGMRVRVTRAVVVDPNAGGPTFTLLPDGVLDRRRTRRGGLRAGAGEVHPGRVPVRLVASLLPPGLAPRWSVGDVVLGVEGVLRYRSARFELLPTGGFAGRAAPARRETTRLVGTPDKVTVGWLNVKNFDARVESKDRLGEGSRADDDLGSGRAAALATQIARNLGAPDVVGLAEIEDDDGAEQSSVVSAGESFAALVAAIVAAGGPVYAWADLPPVNGADGGQRGSNIRVGFLYRPERVSLDAGSLIRLGDGAWPFAGARKSLQATFRFRGQPLVVVANHFMARHRSVPAFTTLEKPVNGGLAVRNAQAEIVRRHVDELVARSPDAKVVVLGDFNESELNEPMEKLAAGVLTNLTTTLPEADRYTYVFDGQSIALDHVFVPERQAAGAEYDVVHANADFVEQCTDHDGLVVRIEMGAGARRGDRAGRRAAKGVRVRATRR